MDSAGQKVAFVAVVAVVVAASAGGAFYFSSSSNVDGSAELVAEVPAGSEVVIAADVEDIIEDPATSDLMNKVLSGSLLPLQGMDLPSSYDDFKNQFEEETGLDIEGINGVTFFSRYGEDSSSGPIPSDGYGGIIVSTDWTEGELVDSIESTGETLTETVYKGVVVYRAEIPEIGFMGDVENRIVLGVLTDGVFVTGTEQAIKDAMDVAVGDKVTISGPLKEEFDRAESGYLKFAMDLPAEQTTSGGGIPGLQTVSDVEYLAGNFSVNGSSVSVEARLIMSDQSSASELKDQIDEILGMVDESPLTQLFKDELGKVSVVQDGSAVVLTYETTVQDLESLMKDLESMPMSGF